MQKRTAHVNQFYTNAISNSSIINIGDTVKTNQQSKALSVQREGPTTTTLDLQYEDYPIFQLEPNFPSRNPSVIKRTYHHKNDINVQNVSLTALSLSSVMQIGSINNIRADSRTKHFRMLQEEEND